MVSPIRSPLSLFSLPRPVNGPTSPLLRERTLLSTCPAPRAPPIFPANLQSTQVHSTCPPPPLNLWKSASSTPLLHLVNRELHTQASCTGAESRALTCDKRLQVSPAPNSSHTSPSIPGAYRGCVCSLPGFSAASCDNQDFPENWGVKEETSHHPSFSLLFHRHRQFFLLSLSFWFSSVQLLSHVQLFATPWIAARQASLSIINSWSSFRLTSIESVMPSSHLILCHPLLLLPPLGYHFPPQNPAKHMVDSQ